MESIKVNTERLDQTVHHVALNDEQLKSLVLAAAAKAAGVTIDRRAVQVKQLYLSSNMGSTGTEYRAICTIVVDHQAQPAALEEPPPPPPAPPTRRGP